MLHRSHDDQRAGSFSKQPISMTLRIGNAACVVGTVSDRDAFEETHYMSYCLLGLASIFATRGSAWFASFSCCFSLSAY